LIAIYVKKSPDDHPSHSAHAAIIIAIALWILVYLGIPATQIASIVFVAKAQDSYKDLSRYKNAVLILNIISLAGYFSFIPAIILSTTFEKWTYQSWIKTFNGNWKQGRMDKFFSLVEKQLG
jgi:hypothetical protein